MHKQMSLPTTCCHVVPHTRYGNPTTRVLEEKIAALEGAEDCVVGTPPGQPASCLA